MAAVPYRPMTVNAGTASVLRFWKSEHAVGRLVDRVAHHEEHAVALDAPRLWVAGNLAAGG